MFVGIVRDKKVGSEGGVACCGAREDAGGVGLKKVGGIGA